MGQSRYDIDVWAYTAFSGECFRLSVCENKAKACKIPIFHSKHGMCYYCDKLLGSSIDIGEESMEIKVVTANDKAFVMSLDQDIDDTGYANRVYTKSGYVIWEKDQRIGIITHCILWDKLPFMNLILVQEEHRGKGFAEQIISWENEMKNQGYKMTLISTQVDEGAQHLYRKLGYIDCGGLVFDHTPFDQPMEMFFRKVL